MFHFRHHCRRCGGLFCNDCCGLTTSLPEQFNQKTRARVCNKCFKLTIRERIKLPVYTSIADGGPSKESKVVSSMQKVLYWYVLMSSSFFFNIFVHTLYFEWSVQSVNEWFWNSSTHRKMGAHDGGMFDRSIVDVAEGATGPIPVQQVCHLF